MNAYSARAVIINNTKQIIPITKQELKNPSTKKKHNICVENISNALGATIKAFQEFKNRMKENPPHKRIQALLGNLSTKINKTWTKCMNAIKTRVNSIKEKWQNFVKNNKNNPKELKL